MFVSLHSQELFHAQELFNAKHYFKKIFQITFAFYMQDPSLSRSPRKRTVRVSPLSPSRSRPCRTAATSLFPDQLSCAFRTPFVGIATRPRSCRATVHPCRATSLLSSHRSPLSGHFALAGLPLALVGKPRSRRAKQSPVIQLNWQWGAQLSAQSGGVRCAIASPAVSCPCGAAARAKHAHTHTTRRRTQHQPQGGCCVSMWATQRKEGDSRNETTKLGPPLSG